MRKELFTGEQIDFSGESILTYKEMSTVEINEKYNKGEVRIITEQARYPLNTILSIVESKDYILNPEFQRRHRWDLVRKSRLIESIIMNVPIPPVFLYEISFSVYEVMDGLQRLTAIAQFYKDEFELEGLQEWPELNGFKYSNLPDQVRKGIDRRYISSIILLQETAKDEVEAKRLKQLVFERINSGGASLTFQESRNAIYPGDLNDLCIKLARNKDFCTLWGVPIPTVEELTIGKISDELVNHPMFSKMEDVELVLRFFAFRQIDKWDNSVLKLFLDNFLKQGNLFPKELLNKYEKTFVETTSFILALLGEKALCLPRERKATATTKWILVEQPTKVAYDTLMFVLSDLLEHKELLLNQQNHVEEKLQNLYMEHSELFVGRFNKSDIIKRIEAVQNLFKEIIQK